eukprot:scaffold29074_cov109-Isochrysis_galbana.AAC.1
MLILNNWRVSGTPIFGFPSNSSHTRKTVSARAMADAASRAGHVQAAAGAAGLSSWRRRPLARPQAPLSDEPGARP